MTQKMKNSYRSALKHRVCRHLRFSHQSGAEIPLQRIHMSPILLKIFLQKLSKCLSSFDIDFVLSVFDSAFHSCNRLRNEYWELGKYHLRNQKICWKKDETTTTTITIIKLQQFVGTTMVFTYVSCSHSHWMLYLYNCNPLLCFRIDCKSKFRVRRFVRQHQW